MSGRRQRFKSMQESIGVNQLPVRKSPLLKATISNLRESHQTYDSRHKLEKRHHAPLCDRTNDSALHHIQFFSDNPVRLVDYNAYALESALRDIKKLKVTANKVSEHKNGVIQTFSSDDLSDALSARGVVSC